jgi:hypothetical protein
MWWGTAIEAPDPGALARFYSKLLGWNVGHEEPGTTILAAPEGSIYVVFQQATVRMLAAYLLEGPSTRTGSPRRRRWAERSAPPSGSRWSAQCSA